MNDIDLKNINELLEKSFGTLKYSIGERTIIFTNKKFFIKVYTTKDKFVRFNNEKYFLENYSNKNIPLLIDSLEQNSFPIIVLQNLPERPVGFISDLEITTLNSDDFINLLDVLLEIQSKEKSKIIVHGDLSPHNIYFDKKFILADWDLFHFSTLEYMRMYDYATLWSWIYNEPDKMFDIFKDVKKELSKRNLLNDFNICFNLRVRNFKKIPGQTYYLRGKKLMDYIMR